MSQILALWATPRSLSTAFERMVRERGDHEVHFEPFAAHYYFSDERRSPRFDGEVEPRPEYGFAAILDRLTAEAHHRPVFVKDMAYHVADRADEGFLSAFRSTFILRHPRFAIRSLARIWPDFTLEEAGFGPLRALFDRVCDLTGQIPPVVDGEDLRADPERVVQAWCAAVGLSYDPDALTWEPGRAPDWETWSPWVGSVERSGGLPVGDTEPPRDPAEVELDDPSLEEAVEQCVADYEHVARHRL